MRIPIKHTTGALTITNVWNKPHTVEEENEYLKNNPATNVHNIPLHLTQAFRKDLFEIGFFIVYLSDVDNVANK